MAFDFPTNPTNGQVYQNFYYDSSTAAWRNLGSKNALSSAVTALQSDVAKRKVLQVVHGSTGTEVAISSTTKVSIGLSATITPYYASSTILIIVTSTFLNPAGGRVDSAPFRNGIELTGGSSMLISTSQNLTPGTFTHLDSPGSTSALTYNVRSSITTGTTYANWAGFPGKITLMEIAA